MSKGLLFSGNSIYSFCLAQSDWRGCVCTAALCVLPVRQFVHHLSRPSRFLIQ